MIPWAYLCVSVFPVFRFLPLQSIGESMDPLTVRNRTISSAERRLVMHFIRRDRVRFVVGWWSVMRNRKNR